MLDYLFYKLYQTYTRSQLWDIAGFATCCVIALLLGLNIMVISFFLVKIDVLPSLLQSLLPLKYQAVLLMLVCIGITSLFFLQKKRYKDIIAKYKDEKNKERIKGNFYVVTYIVVSFLIIYAVAFFRLGKI